MENNWNQLIERYLQHELSEEGRIAFEQELQSDPELQQEFELHNLIYASAIRSVERAQIAQIGKSYHFYKTFKMVSAYTAVVIGTAVAVWVAVMYQKTSPVENHPTIALVNDSIPDEPSVDSTITTDPTEPVVFAPRYYVKNVPGGVQVITIPAETTPVESSKEPEKVSEPVKNPAAQEKEKEKENLPRSLVITTKFGFGKPVITSRDANYLDFQKNGEDLKKQSVYTDEEGLHIVNPKEKLHFVFERTVESRKEKQGFGVWKSEPIPVEDTTTHRAVIRSVRND